MVARSSVVVWFRRLSFWSASGLVMLHGAVAAAWPWEPFQPVRRPPAPAEVGADGEREGAHLAANPIDAFLRAAQAEAGVHYRREASRDVWLRRVYQDLIGLSPSPEERAAFLADTSPDAEATVVDRLLADPRHAERWARHWMDIWRYSDWAGWNDGGQIRDSQPHIWRWRDWIVEALHADLGYDRMITDMLAADERAPEDADALRATGFLVRNYKMLSREQWLEDTVAHTGKALLGLTIGCAKCHDHMVDPIKQTEYYELRAIFEPHQVRLDHVPGQADTKLDGLPRAYDADPAVVTYFFPRGDERNPDKDRPQPPGVPAFLGGAFQVVPVTLPPAAVAPERRDFVREALAAAAAKTATEAKTDAPAQLAKWRTLQCLFAVERLEEKGRRDTPEWEAAAKAALAAQREEALAIARQAFFQITLAHAEAAGKDATSPEHAKKLTEAQTTLEAARQAMSEPLTTAYTPRELPKYPEQSTGRRLAFAKWLTAREHPLTARVAVNHVWARHFGTGLAPSVADFGADGRPPALPALLDWLAVEFMEHGWSFRHLHRLICLSAAYRQDSAPGPDAAAMKAVDQDNRLLWHFPARRLEAEAIRDNVWYLTGGLDLTRGGPEIDQNLALTQPRRSLYFRCAAEKQPDFLQVFDGPSVVECYERRPSIMPQQALALLNSELPLARARVMAERTKDQTDDAALVCDTFVTFLTREPTAAEAAAAREFLQSGGPRARELFFLTLLNHHEFLTLR